MVQSPWRASFGAALLFMAVGCGNGSSSPEAGGSGNVTNTPPAQVSLPGSGRILYSDLDNGPNTGGQDDKGAFVTVYGKNFGASRGTGFVTVGGGAVDNYPVWTDTKIVFQLGANARTGNIAVVNETGQASNGVPFAVRTGPIYFVTSKGTGDGSFASPMSPSAAYGKARAGATFYFRGGTYSSQAGQLGWSDNIFVLGKTQAGTAGNATAFVGYPGEAAIFSGHGAFGLRDSSETLANYVTIANLQMKCTDKCIFSGAITNGGGEIAKSGASNARVVGNVISGNYTWNTMTGLVTIGGDGWRFYGNEIKDTGTTPPINNNHGLYIQVGASDVDVGWNYFHDLKMGHVIQVHTDTAFKYENVRIHDNVLTAANPSDSRGINVGTTLAGSYGAIYDNVLYNLGQDVSGIAIYTGDWDVFNNTLYNIQSSSGMIWLSSQWDKPTARLRNNIFYSNGSSPYVGYVSGTTTTQLTLSNNLYYNKGAGPSADAAAVNADPMFVDTAAANFRLQSGSPAIDKGTSTVSAVVTMDPDGTPRAPTSAFDIGAFEALK